MTIGMEDVVNEVRRLAEEKPDYIYTDGLTDEYGDYNCRYINEEKGVGSCIVGQALVNLRIPVEDILVHEGNPASRVVSELLDLPSMHYNDDRDLCRQRAWLDGVQEYQDNKQPWGDALRVAEEQFPEVAVSNH